MQNNYHNFILEALKNTPKKDLKGFNPQRYMGTSDPYLGISNPEKYKIGRAFHKSFHDITLSELVGLFDQLTQGETFEEKTMPGFIIDRYPLLRSHIKPIHLDRWLEKLTGWCEIDSLCQSTFEADDFLTDLEVWKKYLMKWAEGPHKSKQRASLVLLCKSVAHSPDTRLSNLSFTLIDVLQSEKNILITKAVSWLLRQLVSLHRQEVESYIEQNTNTLPKIALRETRKLLLKGKKT